MNEDTFPENHFENPRFEKGLFSIEYNYKTNDDSNEWLKENIIIDLKNDRKNQSKSEIPQ